MAPAVPVSFQEISSRTAVIVHLFLPSAVPQASLFFFENIEIAEKDGSGDAAL